jgi:hypothetical protein
MRKFSQATESEGEAFPFGRPALARGTHKRWVQATEHGVKNFRRVPFFGVTFLRAGKKGDKESTS